MSKKINLHFWRLKLTFKKLTDFISSAKPVIGLAVENFDNDDITQSVIDLYKNCRQNGYETYILVETDKICELTEQLYDQRHIRIFESDEQKLLDFCFKKNISLLYYHDYSFCMDDARKIGFKILNTVNGIYNIIGFVPKRTL
jgi:hypothetical protein